MSSRPRIKIVPDDMDKRIRALSVILFLLMTAFTCWLYDISPDKVPGHFDINGNINRYDNKITVFIMPMIALVILLLLNFLTRIPHIYNYPQSITAETAPAMYKAGAKMLRYLCLGLMLLFCYIQYEMYIGIRDKYLPMHWWELVLVLLLTTVLPIIISIKGFRGRKK